MERIPEVKLFGEYWAWALFQAGQAWMAWQFADELDELDHHHLAGVYRKYARQLARNALPFAEELARHGVARDIHSRISSILESGSILNPVREEV